ncbi:hypothetical protein CVIRNUC_007010 [Coccomyxa viridis]|uniref:DUF7880 domain-containing protein n=1 Tax=Coccomyxa viridis TaxID=1274662 RepID=A0AAV1IBX9_9CHLO|nr:hypothetical protein CVIRNUC_007010 [Coccomyxa viridis]
MHDTRNGSTRNASSNGALNFAHKTCERVRSASGVKGVHQRVRVAVSEAVKVIRHRDTEKTGDMRSGSLHTQQAAEGYSLRSCQHHELSHRLYTHRRRIQDHSRQPVTSASTSNERIASNVPSRRQAMQLAGIALIAQQSDSAWAGESRGMSRYVKKKALDPLETYVPAVIQARDQLVDAGKLMDQDPIEARIRLRSNAFEGLRENIRALGEYATTNNATSESSAKALVNKTFGSIQEFDFQLFSATRAKQPVGKEAADRLQQAVTAMDDLLATVPADSISRAREVLQTIESRAVEKSGGNAVEAFDAQRLEKLVPDAS